MKTKYRNVAFLLELMINILVFSVSCAILVGLFGRAGTLSRRTREKTCASTELLSMVETIKAKGTDGLALVEWTDDENLVRRYDADWKPTSDPAAPYVLHMYVGRVQYDAGELRRMQGSVETAGGEELFSVDTAAYQPEEAAAEGGGAA